MSHVYDGRGCTHFMGLIIVCLTAVLTTNKIKLGCHLIPVDYSLTQQIHKKRILLDLLTVGAKMISKKCRKYTDCLSIVLRDIVVVTSFYLTSINFAFAHIMFTFTLNFMLTNLPLSVQVLSSNGPRTLN